MPKGWMNLDSLPENANLFGGEEPAFDLGLTRMQRIMAFGGCFVGGLAISLLGAILIMLGQPGAFAAFFALGGLISLAGTGFLIGFKRQFKLMFKKVRIVATIVMFASIILCFVFAFLVASWLCIIFVIIQYLAMAWYSLSYIPYARDAVKGLFRSAV